MALTRKIEVPTPRPTVTASHRGRPRTVATPSPAPAAAAGACGRTLTGSTVDRRLLGPLVVLGVRISRGRGSGSRVLHDPGDDRPRHDRDGRLFVLRERVEGAEYGPPLDRAEPIRRLRQHDPVDL